MVDLTISTVCVLIVYIGDVSAMYHCYEDGTNKFERCEYKCCGKPNANSTETNLLPCCPIPPCGSNCNTDDGKGGIPTSIAGAVFTTVFSLVFLGSMCLCFQRILTRARNNRGRGRPTTAPSHHQYSMSVRDIRASHRRSGNVVIATIGDILTARYNENFDDFDEEEARVPKPAEIDKQLPSYEEAVRSGNPGSPPPYDYTGYKPQTSTSGGHDNEAFHFDSSNQIHMESSSLPSLDNAAPPTQPSESPSSSESNRHDSSTDNSSSSGSTPPPDYIS